MEYYGAVLVDGSLLTRTLVVGIFVDGLLVVRLSVISWWNNVMQH